MVEEGQSKYRQLCVMTPLSENIDRHYGEFRLFEAKAKEKVSAWFFVS
jgi:hypothetical protein